MEGLSVYLFLTYAKYALLIAAVPVLFLTVGFICYCINEYRHWR